MFAGEGGPERTNKRFHYVSRGLAGEAAVDRVRLGHAVRRGSGPPPRHLRQGRQLAACRIAASTTPRSSTPGFDLADPSTSVSMTINGPAPMLLGFFLNAADRPAVREVDPRSTVRSPRSRRRSTRCTRERGVPRPRYQGEIARRQRRPRPAAARASPATRCCPPRSTRRSRPTTLSQVRGTVQADILKEDQAQNTCIFSTEFALRLMGDIQQYFIDAQGAELLLGLDQRLSHRRGRREPDHASSRSRSPTASPSSSTTCRAGCTSTTSRRTCRSSSRTAWTPSTR